jgi:Mn-containing catalase
VDSKGSFWDARYVNEGGDVVRDLRADVAAEAGALATYEALIRIAPDDGTRAALVHLATREVAHTHMFMAALQSMNKLDQPMFGDLKPDDSVNLYFNLSSGPDADQRGPWNSEPAFQYVADPLQHEMQQHAGNTPASNEMMVPQGSSQNRQGSNQSRQNSAPTQTGQR